MVFIVVAVLLAIAVSLAVSLRNFPYDGRDEYGLAVEMMALSYAKPARDPQKVTLGSLHAMRLILDYAKDVDEAVSLLQKHNVDFAGGPPCMTWSLIRPETERQ